MAESLAPVSSMVEETFESHALPSEAMHTILSDLLPALQRLDILLGQAAVAMAADRSVVSTDAFRGLYISPEEVAELLQRAPGAPRLYSAPADRPTALNTLSRLTWLAQAFGLSDFDIDVLLLSLAPELDRRYERLYAYLQDHVSRRWPTVDLALNLLCPHAASRLERRTHFDPDAPLIRHGLVHLIPDPDYNPPSLLAHTLQLDEQIVRLLLHQDSLDKRLAGFCRLVVSGPGLEDLPLTDEFKQALPALLRHAWEEDQPLRLYFQGPPGAGRRQSAAALANELGLSLLVVDLNQALATNTDLVQLLPLIFRYAWFYGVIPYLDGLNALDEQPALYQQVLNSLDKDLPVLILAGRQPWLPTPNLVGVLVIPFATPDFTERRNCWQSELAVVEVVLLPADLDILADRFHLTSGQIVGAVAEAQCRAHWRSALTGEAVSLETRDLFAGARAQSGHDLAALAHKVEPLYTWADIILPDDALAQLRELCQRVTHRQRVLDQWGFGRKLSSGKGLNALFAGPSGTGKTMAAEIIANEMGLDLYKIDLAGVVSKYIGETEKNLDRIFRAAENANAILFFDEADALFGKRSEVRDSHDRYANIEISYLLQKMEEYAGLSILATNLRQNLDEAFVRRLAFTVHFPFPDEAGRRRIWGGIWPAVTPLATTMDLDFMARQFKLSGGNIRNIGLAAAFLAAADGGVVTMPHLLHATRREYQKLGKALSDAELNGAQLFIGKTA